MAEWQESELDLSRLAQGTRQLVTQDPYWHFRANELVMREREREREGDRQIGLV